MGGAGCTRRGVKYDKARDAVVLAEKAASYKGASRRRRRMPSVGRLWLTGLRLVWHAAC